MSKSKVVVPKECSICEDEVTSENPIATCIECGLQVHVYCYGVTGQFASWMCSPCLSGKTKFVSCQLCLQKGGAMKETSCNKWVHVICALFTKGVMFCDEKSMEPVDISKVNAQSIARFVYFAIVPKGSAVCAQNPNAKIIYISHVLKKRKHYKKSKMKKMVRSIFAHTVRIISQKVITVDYRLNP